LLARQVGIKDIVVFINKIDTLDDPEMIELVEMEMRDLLSEYGFDGENVPFVKGSALCALNGTNKEIGEDKITELMEIIDTQIPTPVRDLDKPFLLPIEHIYSIAGRGTVVTGKLIRGVIHKGDEVEIVGYGEPFKSICTGIESFHKELDKGMAGDDMGVLLRGLKREQLHRGQVVCRPGLIKSHKKFQAQLYILKKEEGGRHKPFMAHYTSQLFLRTTDVTATLTHPEGTPNADEKLIMPGDNVLMNLELLYDVAVEEGLRFTIRESGKTVGTGVVTKVLD